MDRRAQQSETKDRETINRHRNDSLRPFVITSSNRWITIGRVRNKSDVAERLIDLARWQGQVSSIKDKDSTARNASWTGARGRTSSGVAIRQHKWLRFPLSPAAKLSVMIIMQQLSLNRIAGYIYHTCPSCWGGGRSRLRLEPNRWAGQHGFAASGGVPKCAICTQSVQEMWPDYEIPLTLVLHVIELVCPVRVDW